MANVRNIITNSNDNVLIGTDTDNGFKLNVTGNQYISSKLSIGTTYNGFALNVSGIAYIIGGSVWVQNGYGYTNSGATSTGLYPLSDNTIQFRNNNTTNVVIDASGRVGIGTTAPTQLLSVAGNTDLGNSIGSVTSSTYTTRLSGYALYYDASNRYGNYGVLLLNADSGWTSSSRRFMITNGYNANRFAIIRSVDATTDPALGYGGSVTSGTVDFEISSAGAATFGSSVTTVGAIQSGGDIIIQNTYPRIQLIDTDNNSDFNIINNNGNFSIYDDTNSSHRLWIDSTGNVGIGTTSPVEKLDVRGGAYIDGGTNNNTYDATLYVTAASSNDWGIFVSKPSHDYGIISQVGNGASYGLSVYDGTTHNFVVKGNGTTLIQGNVGIGTTAPGTNLEITTAGSSTTVYPLSLTNPVNEPGTVGGAGIRFSTSSGPGGAGNEANKYSSIEAFDVNNYGSNSGLSFTTSLGYTKTKSMVIDRNGNVGIGTTTPGGRFSVIGTISQNTTLQAANTWANLILDSSASANADTNFVYANAGSLVWDIYNDGSTNALSINTKTIGGAGIVATFLQNGNVGIGNTSPTAKLQVGAEAHPSANGIEVAAGAGGANLLALTNSTNHNWFPFTDGKNYYSAIEHTFRNELHSTDWMKITSGGNVGIGTTSPGGRLHIATPDPATNFVAIDFRNPTYGIYGKSNSISGRGNTLEFTATDYNTNGSVVTRDVLTLRPEGNVGIGITNPTVKLDVDGPGRFVSDAASRVLYLKQNANNAGNIIQFQNESGTNTWELVGRNNQFYFYNANLANFPIYIHPATSNVSMSSAVDTGDKLFVNGTIAAVGGITIRESGSGILSLVRQNSGFSARTYYYENANLYWDVGMIGGSYSWRVNDPNFGVNNKLVVSQGFDWGVGIGTDSPTRRLHIVGTTRHERVYAYANNVFQFANDIPQNELWLHLGTQAAFTTDKIYYRVNTNTSEEEGEIIVKNTCATANIEWFRNSYNVMVTAVKARMQGGCGACEIFIRVRYGSNYLGANTTVQWQVHNGTDSGFTTVNAVATPGTGTNEANIASTDGYMVSTSNNQSVGGNLGVGTTSPSYRAQIETSTGTLASWDNGDGAIWSTLTSAKSIGLSSGTNYAGSSDFTWMKLTGGSSGNIIFSVNNEVVRMLRNGNVLIGTTTDAGYKLRVNGSSYFDAPILCYTGNGYITALTNDGVGSNFGFGYSFLINNTGHEIGRIAGQYQDSAGGGTGGVGIYTRQAGTLNQRLIVSGDGTVQVNNNAANSTAGTNFIAYAVDSDSYFRLGNNTSNSLDIQLTRSDTATMFSVNGHTGLAYFAGNVLIGTTTDAGYKLYVSGTGTSTNLAVVGNIRAGGTGTAGGEIIASGALGNGNFVSLRHDDNNAYITVTRTVYDGHLILQPYGNVGIGTTSPASKLQVSYTSSSTTTVDNGITILNDNGAENNFVGIRLSTYGDATGGLYPKQFIGAVRDANGAGQGDIVFLNRNAADTSVVSASDEVMRITNTAKVGIGTTSPSESSKLTISSVGEFGIDLTNTGTGGVSWQLGATNNAYSAGGGKFVLTYGNASNASVFTAVQSTGNIGIGTTSPMGPLEVYKSNSGGLGGHIILNNNGTAVGNETAVLFNDSGVGGNNSVRAAISSSVEGAPYFGDLKFKTGASAYGSLNTRMIITGAGNVGIGTTSPSAPLHVKNPGDNGGVRYTVFLGQNSTGYQNSFVASVQDELTDLGAGIVGTNTGSNLSFSTHPNGGALTERMRITKTGNVGIGTASPTTKLHVNGGSIFNQDGFLYMSNQFPIVWGAAVSIEGDNVAGTLTLKTESSHRIFINNVGNVGVGTTAPAYKLDVSGTIRATGDVIAYSDARVKENVETIDGALDKVMKMRGVSYNKIGEHEKKVGVIAQEILKVLPEVVSQDETGTYSVAYGNITAVLIEAVKELASRVELLEEKLKQQ
jgi:hypothetical protein